MNPNSFQPNESTQTMESLPIAMNAGRQSIVVRAPTLKVYERWSQFENFPRFITPVREVRRIDDTHFSFICLRDGKERKCVVRVLLRIPEQRIAWGQFPTVLPPVSSRSNGPSIRIRKSRSESVLSIIRSPYPNGWKNTFVTLND